MKDAFKDYFSKMGLTDGPQLQRLEDIVKVAQGLFPDEMEEVFISQSSEENGNVTEWDSLWFFSGKYCLEARQFTVHNDFEIHRLEGIQNLRLIVENCVLGKFPTTEALGPKSTMTAEFTPQRGGRCQLYAFSHNCEKLAFIAKKYLQTNL
jgi:hypothetical protein